MPASWRPSRGAGVVDNYDSSIDEIVALAGVDEMTIPPTLLDILSSQTGTLRQQCFDKPCQEVDDIPGLIDNQQLFLELMKQDACCTEKLNQGIDAFTKETEKLEQALIEKFS